MVGVLPYILYGEPFTLTNSWFESVSGFTTTGSSILSDIEALPKGLLFWRAATHWIGGIGIIVFMLTVMPYMGTATMVLYRTELSPLGQDNFHYRTQKTVKIILYIYIGLTLLETLGLYIFGMNFFDAITHAFATVATGGFSTKNTSLAYFSNLSIEITIIIFMLLSGIHFGLLFSAVSGNPRELYKSSNFRYYIIALAVGVFLVSINTHGSQYAQWPSAFRYSTFQVISLGTSTGFANADSTLWPAFTQIILIFFTLQCACAGSTSGGIKTDRMVIFWKSLMRSIVKLRHPRAVVSIKVDKAPVEDEIVETALIYITLYLAVLFLSTLMITLFDIDIMTAFSGTAAAMGNVGPGFGAVGSMGNYAKLPDFVKWILTFDMLVGRLEISGLILFVSLKQWR
jgi:trk system potassium uptake protein TrkH